MPSYPIKEIALIIGGKLIGNNDTIIKYLQIDSRNFLSNQETLFFAIEGERHNGHDYINDLYEKFVRNFVVSKLPDIFLQLTDANFILVDNTLNALQLLTAHHRHQFFLPVLGITGSNGKTGIKEWIFQLLQGSKKIIRSPKSYNSQVGVPLSVWLLEDGYDLAIFEAGISKPGEMERLQKIIDPTIGLFTTIGDAHQENFPDIQFKVDEKLKLFTNCETIIFCSDHTLVEQRIKSASFLDKTKLFTWSVTKDADLKIVKIQKEAYQTKIKAIFKSENIGISIPFIDDASVENAIHCWAFLLFMDIPAVEYFVNLEPLEMRLELKRGINNCTIINDSYNCDIASLRIGLDLLNQQQQSTKKTLILSDIFQSGKSENELYTEVAELLSQKNLFQVIGIGHAMTRNSDKFKLKKHFFKSTKEFLENISKEHFKDEIILLKGARHFEFEKISQVLQLKSHRTVLEINLEAMVNNLNFFRSLLKPDTKIMAMVKAFSYGSGNLEIANVLQHQRIDYLGVAFADEGVELRKGGITLPIVVMNPENDSFPDMFDYQLEPEIFSFSVLDKLYKSIKQCGIKRYAIHIKLETGMNRSGFVKDELIDLIRKLKGYKEIYIKSVFSHLAASDEEIHDDFTLLQIKRFEEMSSNIMSEFNYHIMRHILNSSGLERFSGYQFDLVRLGIGLYGVGSKFQEKLCNVSTLKTFISQVKRVESSDTIGYGRKGTLLRNTIIATIPIGYADGLSRSLSNGVGKVLVNNKFAPIIGNICMDITMIDITDVSAKEGDEVIIFGDYHPVTELAKQLNTIPYEILTNVSSRVKRIYYQ